MIPKPTILMYRNELPETSDMFIGAEAESLGQFRPVFVGMRHGSGPWRSQGQEHLIGGPGMMGSFQRGRFKVLGPSRALLTTLGKMRPALIHADFGLDIGDALSIAESLKVPLVVTVHDYDATMTECGKSEAFLRHYNRLKTTAACFLCATEYAREKLLANGFPTGRLQVHYAGVDTQFFTADPAIERSPVVLFVGQLTPERGVEDLIRAMYHVEAVIPEAKLMVIGDGPLRPKLQAFAQKYQRNIEFLSAQEPAVVREWMNRASVLCTLSSSTGPNEGESVETTFAKAQSMGLPAVSYAAGGIPEIVVSDETGYLVADGDREALATRLLALLLNPKKWVQFSRASQLRAKRLFDIRQQALKLEDIYQRVITEWNEKTAQQPSRGGTGQPLSATETRPAELQLSA